MAGVDQYTKILMHMDDSEFIDSMGHVVTNNGVSLDTNIKKLGNGSGYFNGISSYLTTPKETDFEISTGDFTIEAWVRKDATANPCTIIAQSQNAGTIQSMAFVFDIVSDKLRFLYPYGYSGLYYALNGTTTINANTWYHCSITRSGNILSLFINGVVEYTQDVATNPVMQSQSTPITIGRMGDYDGNYFKGYIDELRISKGVARWTSNFTPPNAPYGFEKYLIQQSSNIFAINSSFYGGTLPTDVANLQVVKTVGEGENLNTALTKSDIETYGTDSLDDLRDGFNLFPSEAIVKPIMYKE